MARPLLIAGVSAVVGLVAFVVAMIVVAMRRPRTETPPPPAPPPPVPVPTLEEAAAQVQAVDPTGETIDAEVFLDALPDTAPCRADRQPQDGTCPTGFELREGCCRKYYSDAPTTLEKVVSVGAVIAQDIVLSAAAGIVLDSIGNAIKKKTVVGQAVTKTTRKMSAKLTRISQQLAARAASLSTKLGGRVGGRLGVKAAVRATSQAAAKLATKLALKIAAKMTAMLSKIASNPLGLLFAAFDMVCMALDMADTEGYNNFQSNHDMEKMRNGIEMKQYDYCKENNIPYPPMFYIRNAFPDAFDAAYASTIQDFILGRAISLLPDEFQEVCNLIVESTEEGEDPVLPKEIQDAINAVWDEAKDFDLSQRDAFLFARFQEQLPEDQRDLVALYPSQATDSIFGISLSEKGVRWWNETHRADWLEHNDPFKNLPANPDERDVALFTRTYRVPDEENPTTDWNDPHVVERTLPEAIPMSLPIGKIFAMCEKVHNVGFMGSDIRNESTAVDPYEFGVRFNYTTGVCTFTQRWCTRMGLQYRGPDYTGPEATTTPYITDCHLPPGQEAAEFLTCTTAVRGIVRAASQVPRITFDHPEVERRVTQHTRRCSFVLGRTWEYVGTERPADTQVLQNAALSELLTASSVLTDAEWTALGVTVTAKTVVESNGGYYRPAMFGDACLHDSHCSVGKRCLPDDASGALACTDHQCKPGGHMSAGQFFPECTIGKSCRADGNGIRRCS